MPTFQRYLLVLAAMELAAADAVAWENDPPPASLVDVITTATLPISPDFHSVGIGGFGSLHIVQGAETKLTVTTDIGYLQRVKASVKDGQLGLGNAYGEDGLYPKLEFELTVPSLDEINVSGGARLSAGAFVAESMAINCNGGARADIFALGAVDLVIRVSGGGRVEFSRLAAGELEVFGSGGGAVYVTDHYWVQDVHTTLNGGAAFRTGEDGH